MYYKHNGMSSIKWKTYARDYRSVRSVQRIQSEMERIYFDDFRCLQACAKGESGSLWKLW